MIYKYTLIIVAVLVYFYMCIQTYEHCNAWLGIGGALFGGVFLLERLIKKLKNLQ